jgi:putative ABC transport system permease protein
VFRATVKSLLARKLRFALTALSVVLGVGFVAGTFVLTDTMNKAFDQLFSAATANTDVLVRARASFNSAGSGGGGGSGSDRLPLSEDVLGNVRRVNGVSSASGDVTGYAQFVDPKTGQAIGGFGPPTFGTNWNPGAGGFRIRSGQPPDAGDEVAMDIATARKYGFHVGDEVQILLEGAPETFRVVGLAGFGQADNIGGATSAIFNLPTAQRVLDRRGELDDIFVQADPGISPSELRGRVAAALPKGVEAVTGATAASEDSQAIKDGLGFFRTALLVFATVSLFVGAFIIFNTFSIIVAQRTQELGLLRALGASRRQILTSVAAEAAITGVVAAAIGVVAGIGIAAALQSVLSAFGIDLPSTSTQLEPRTVFVSVVVGLAVTLISAILPARRAARVAPIEALRDSASNPAGAGLRRRIAIGAVVTLAGVGILLYGLFGSPAKAGLVVGAGAALTFLGVAILAPLVAAPIARALGAPLARLGITGTLGRENAMRNPRRTASTASALMIGLGLVTLVAILGASLKASSDAVLDDTLRADFILTTSSFTPFSPDVARKLDDLPEVDAVESFRQNAIRVHGSDDFVVGVDPASLAAVTNVGMTAGSISSLSRGRSVLVHTDVADAHDWSVGDRIGIQFPSIGDRTYRIGGLYSEDRLLGNFVISNRSYDRAYPDHLDSFVFVTGAPGMSADALHRAIDRKLHGYPSVEVQDQAAFKAKQAGFVDRLLGLITALLALAVVIALFGIANTLSLSIFERRRELGLLRAVGMTRRQVRRMIRWESVIIAMMGAVLGIAIGVFFGWALQRALSSAGVTVLAIPAGQLAGYLLFAAIAGVVTAILPARRASRLDVLRAIAYE